MNFFREELPEIAVLAEPAVRAFGYNNVLVLENAKEIARLLVGKILINEQIEFAQEDPFRRLEAIIEIDLLPQHLVNVLKQLEYTNPQESDLFIAENVVEKLMLSTFDLVSWYIRTYMNDQFIPPPMLLRPRMAALSSNSAAIPENKPDERKSIVWIDGKRVEGNWIDRQENESFIDYESNENYRGQVSHGMKSGQGVYRWSDGTKYDGEWFQDREYGYGTKEYANGDSYRGEWKEGLFQGLGIYEWRDGARYEGSWQENLEHGYGIKVYADGTVQKGFWTLGEFVFTSDQLAAEHMEARAYPDTLSKAITRNKSQDYSDN